MANISKRSGAATNVTDLNHLVNRLLDPNWFGEESGQTNVLVTNWVPRINIKNEPNLFIVHADVPGVDIRDIEVSVEDGTLIIQGTKETKTEKKTDSYIRIERSTGSFYRSISLPEAVDPQKIKAKAKNGVLEVIVPKAKIIPPKKIKVKK